MSNINFLQKITNFISKYKSYIIILIICTFSVVSLVVQNANEKSMVNINGEEIEMNKEKGKIGVYITGEVNNPGVYYIDENSRLNDLIELSGGLTQNADLTELNLAEKLSDSDKIDVPKINHNEDDTTIENEEKSSDLININKASKEELKTLNGIGDTLAQNIIEYRKKSKFETIEELLNVSGIGNSKFESIREYICVN